jgi:hypothetical protein
MKTKINFVEVTVDREAVLKLVKSFATREASTNHSINTDADSIIHVRPDKYGGFRVFIEAKEP